MTNETVVDELENMSDRDLANIKRELLRIGKNRPYTAPGIFVRGYLKGTWVENLRIAIEIAYKNGYIQKKTLYAFTTEATKTYINAIITQKTAVKENIDS